jgi:hypothetical protein
MRKLGKLLSRTIRVQRYCNFSFFVSLVHMRNAIAESPAWDPKSQKAVSTEYD